MVMATKVSEPKRSDSGWPVFCEHKFHRNMSENVLRGKYHWFFHSENVSKSSDSKLWTSHGFISEIDRTVTVSSGPLISHKFSSLTKTRFSQSVLKVLQNHSRDVCVTLSQFCLCHIFWPWAKMKVIKVKKVKFWKMLQIVWNVCKIKIFFEIHL